MVWVVFLGVVSSADSAGLGTAVLMCRSIRRHPPLSAGHTGNVSCVLWRPADPGTSYGTKS